MRVEQRNGVKCQVPHSRLVRSLAICLTGIIVQVAIILLAIQNDTSNAQGSGDIIFQNLPANAQQDVAFSTVITFTPDVTDTVSMAHFVTPPDGVTLATLPSGFILNTDPGPGGFVGADRNEVSVVPGDIITATFGWQIGQTGLYTYTTYVSGELTFGFATQVLSVTVTPADSQPPDFEFTGAVTPSSVEAGDILTYTIDVTNFGLEPATNTSIFFPTPDSLTVLTTTVSQGSFEAASGSITYTLETLDPEVTFFATLQALVNDLDFEGTLTNSVVITAPLLTAFQTGVITTTILARDGNNNNVPDRLETNVASTLIGVNALTYAAVLTDTTVSLVTGVVPLGKPETFDLPFGNTFISNTITGPSGDGIGSSPVFSTTPVQIYLPLVLKHSDLERTNSLATTRANGNASANVNAYAKFGPTPDNPTPHWYLFTFDGETGLQAIEGNVMVLHFADGKRGDDDLTVNGMILDPGAPAFVASEAAMAPGANTPQDKTASAGASEVPMLQFAVGAPNNATRIESVTLSASGTGDDASDITAVKVYLDADGDGQVGAGDTQLASGTFAADDGNTALPLSPVQDIAANGSANFLVTYDFNTTLVAMASPRLRLARATTGLMVPSSGSPGSLPLAPLLLVVPLLAGVMHIRRARRLMMCAVLIVSILWLMYGCSDDDGGRGITRTFTATLNSVTATDPNAGGASAITGLPVTGATVTVQ